MATSQTTRKKGLADMLPALSAPAEAPSVPVAERPTAPKPPESKLSQPSKQAAATTPAYLALQRKETRLREEQIDALTAAARELNRAKSAGGERITENTLIRVAVDLLLSNTAALKGATENEIRNSVGL